MAKATVTTMTNFYAVRQHGTSNDLLKAACEMEKAATSLRKSVDVASYREWKEDDIDWVKEMKLVPWAMQALHGFLGGFPIDLLLIYRCAGLPLKYKENAYWPLFLIYGQFLCWEFAEPEFEMAQFFVVLSNIIDIQK